jgi:NADPH-dependent 2,4-dienoyl-CoA reductase/sulfur reductase-like enzyme/rhodanese-related sulfurtransferase/TusA-related sulfurtransferase
MEGVMKVVIVGGSAGGASVAARLRRLDELADITLFEKSSTISFATCGIPYYLGGVIKERDKLNVVSRDVFETILDVNVRTHCEVYQIDRKRKVVTVRDERTGEQFEESFDKLVLATGGKPIIPFIEGIDASNVFTLRTAEDTDAAKAFISKNTCKNALVVGAGFIGLEMAENLHNIGMNVSVVDMAGQVMGTWDYEMAMIIHHHLASKGVNLILNDAVNEIREGEVFLESAKAVLADIIIVCIGVTPNTDLAQRCDLQIGQSGGICVNDGLITSDENIFALGDAVEVKDKITHNYALMPLANIAHKQAQVIAENICAKHKVFKDVQTTAIAKVFDLSIAITGCSERYLRDNNFNYKKSYIEVPAHAGYYPDAHPMIIKLLFTERSGRLLGAQIVGALGVDKRIDIISTVMFFGKTVYDLIDLELAYAPPYSSAKDPINIAGMVAKNMLKEGYEVVHWDEIDALINEDSVLLDVRTNEEYELRCINGAINIPLSELRERVYEIPKDKKIVIYCQLGKKGYFATRILKQLGYKDVVNLSGGFKIYHLINKQNDHEGIFDNESVTSADDIVTLSMAEDSGENDIIFEPQRRGNGLFDFLFNSNVTNEIQEDGNDTVVENDSIPLYDSENENVIYVDACGMSCPGPIMALSKTMKTANNGDIVKIEATDMAFCDDIVVWARKKGHKLLNLENQKSKTIALIQKT